MTKYELDKAKMFTININYFLKFCWLISLLSACQLAQVKELSRVSSSPSSLKSALTSTLAKTQPKQSLSHPIFNGILPRLKDQTKLAIRLPAYIPESDSSNPIYAILAAANASKYTILIAFTEKCTGGNACRLGSTSAEAITPKSPMLTGKAVALAKGITGYFTDATCGANCSDARLSWEQNSVRYSVAIKAGKLETLVQMANSAIATKPQPTP